MFLFHKDVHFFTLLRVVPLVHNVSTADPAAVFRSFVVVIQADILLNFCGNFRSITHQLLLGFSIVLGIRLDFGVTSAPLGRVA